MTLALDANVSSSRSRREGLCAVVKRRTAESLQGGRQPLNGVLVPYPVVGATRSGFNVVALVVVGGQALGEVVASHKGLIVEP